MNKVFVTGADGMLGNSICRQLIASDYAVKALCLNEKNSYTLEGIGIEIIYGNILDKDMLTKEMAGCSYVIHAAAMTDVWPRRSQKVKDVNTIGTKNIMDVAKEIKIKRMLHISSASSFEHGDLHNPGTETSSYSGWKYGLDYIDSKYMAQELLLSEFRKTGFPVIIINPTFMIGPFDSGPSSGKMIVALYKNSIPGYSNGGKNFVCSGDVAVATVNALTMGKTGECYIAGNHNMSYGEFFRAAAQVMEKKMKLKALPYWLIVFVGAINSAFARLNGKAPKLSYSMAKMSNINQYYSGIKAREELKMPETPIKTGIKQFLDWYYSSANRS